MKMCAMVLEAAGRPLRRAVLPIPVPGPGQVLLKVIACGVCRTDLHLADGEITGAKLPLILGHEIVGLVAETGQGVQGLKDGDRVGVSWLARACAACAFCRSGRENLCGRARFTGCHVDGGYAEFAKAEARYCLRLPRSYSDEEAAPLLCAGAIGHRALRAAGDARRLGLYGFGAAAHIVAQVARRQGRRVYAFTRPGDLRRQSFAREQGAVWAGDSLAAPPEELDAAIIFAPAGGLVPAALRALAKGGTVICAGIHMSDIPSFPYSILWQERAIKSVANLTRRDAEEFLKLAPKVPVRVKAEVFALEDANEALSRLRRGEIEGAAVLRP